jgi:hypothetical protein
MTTGIRGIVAVEDGPRRYPTPRLLTLPDPTYADPLARWQQFGTICRALLATAAHAVQMETNAGKVK